LLERGARVTQTNKNGWNALHYAAKAKQLDMLRLFIEGSAEGTLYDEALLSKGWIKDSWTGMDQVSRQGFNLFHIAALYCDSALARYLVDSYERRERILKNFEVMPEDYANLRFKTLKQNLEAVSHGKYSPLLLAVKESRAEMAKFLTSLGCNAYLRNERLQNVLHLGCLEGCQELIEYFVQYDSDKNLLRTERDIKQRKARDFDVSGKFSESFSHIWDYARDGNEAKIREVIRRKRFGVNELTPKLKLSPLHCAVESKQLAAIKVLIELGGDPYARNNEGVTPVDLALNYRDSSIEAAVLKLLRTLKTCAREDEQGVLKRQMQRRRMHAPQLSLVEQELRAITRKKSIKESEHFEVFKKKLNERGTSLDDLYKMIDKQPGDCLTSLEFEGVLTWLGVSLTQASLRAMIGALDSEDKGEIDYSRLQQRLC
jgi:ankyrin repeat protein